MGGLYRRALEIYHKYSIPRPVPAGGDGSSMDDIPEADRESVRNQIDRIIEKNRLQIEPEGFRPVAASSGILLPVAANAAIALVAAVLIVFFSLRLNREERRIQSGESAIQTAESLVVQAVRQESAEQLQKKDTEILGIQQKLEQASRERDAIRSETERTIQQREQEFAGKLETALTAERNRLAKMHLSRAQIEQQLTDYETRLRSDYQQQFEQYRAQAEAQATEREAALTGRISTYETSLKQSQDDRKRLEQEYANREAQLAQQATERSQKLELDRTQAQAELARLQDAQAQQTLLSAQILASYSRARSQIAAPDYPGALKTLEALRSSFDSEPALSSHAIQERRPVDMFIIGSLEELIRSREDQAPTPAKAASPVPSPEAEARIAAGRKSYDAGSWQATLEQYRQALDILLDNPDTADQLVSQVADAGYRIRTAGEADRHAIEAAALSRLSDLSTRIGTLRSRVGTMAPENGHAPMSSEELTSLLQAKLLVWQIIGTDPVKSKYPQLYDTMQRYFDTFAAQQEEAGRRAGLQSVLSLLDALDGNPQALAAAPQPQTDDDRALLIQILDHMSSLTRPDVRTRKQ
jgi:hypothetical protein